MSTTGNVLKRIISGTFCLAALGCASYAPPPCTLPITKTFGLVDLFAPTPSDPIPYNPALPQFVQFLNGNPNNIPTTSMTTFDAQTPDRHMVASLRHGLRGCFAGATGLNLCFLARALPGNPSNDNVYIYNTNFTNYTFPIIFSSAITPPLVANWNTGTTNVVCVNLTTQMSQIGDMLQFRIQDDTEVDFIAMTLW